ncbi:hypothetical protein BJS_09009 [Bradyrhizobium japonicum SEMIA 5079]|nr:hypothetical protein BJS_09009 [Bradyrhizobium japonicum SEMIA 5079]
MFHNRLDRAILAGGVATFDDDKDSLAALNHAALQLDELDEAPARSLYPGLADGSPTQALLRPLLCCCSLWSLLHRVSRS